MKKPHASNQDDTLNNQELKEDAVTVSSISLKKDDVDVSVAIATDTGVILVYSEKPHASNKDDNLNNKEVKENAVTVSSISLKKGTHI